MSLLAFCNKALSSPKEGSEEIFLNNGAPEFMQEKKVASLFIQFFSDRTVPPPSNKILFKTSCKWNNVWKNCSSTLWTGEFVMELGLQAVRYSIMPSTFALLHEFRDNF